MVGDGCWYGRWVKASIPVLDINWEKFFIVGQAQVSSSVMPFKQQIRESQFFSIVVSEVFRSTTTHVD